LTASDVVSQTTARDASNATTPNPRLDTSSGIEVSSPREECFGELSEDGIADDNAQKATDYNAQVTLSHHDNASTNWKCVRWIALSQEMEDASLARA
jgi:hypothetical protein